MSIGQNTLHTAISLRCPGSFQPDVFASADQYFEGIFERETRPGKPVSPPMTQILFRVDLKRNLVCPVDQSHQLDETKHLNSITLDHSSFQSQFSYSESASLLTQWSENGIQRVSERHCKTCKVPFNKLSQLTLAPPPPHLTISLDIAFLLGTRPAEAKKMMADCDLPYKLSLGGVTSRMRARGFWREGHYWCKVVRTVGGLTGVWYNNDMENDGMARLVSRDLETIGGASPSTSWVMYSRAPTEEESVIFKRADEKINKSIGKKGVVDRPFSQSKNDADEDKDLLDQDGNWEDDQGLPEDFDMLDNCEDVKPLFCSDLQAEEEPTESKPQVQLREQQFNSFSYFVSLLGIIVLIFFLSLSYQYE